MRTSDGAVLSLAYSLLNSGWGISDRLPSFPSLLFFLFYGHSLVRGVVVSGGEGVQWKVAEAKAARSSSEEFPGMCSHLS